MFRFNQFCDRKKICPEVPTKWLTHRAHMILLFSSGYHVAGVCWDGDALTHGCLQWTDS